jgi:ABC-type phosphate transport system substrate-binding protein
MDKRLVMRWAVLGSAVLAVLALAACGDDDEGPIPQTGVRETTTTPASSTTTTAATSTTTASTSTTTAPSA